MKIYVLTEAADEYSDECSTGYMFSTEANAKRFVADYNNDITYKWKPTIKEIELDPVFSDIKVVWSMTLNKRGELITVSHTSPGGDMQPWMRHDHGRGQVFHGRGTTMAEAFESVTKFYEAWKSCIITETTPSQQRQRIDRKKFKELTGQEPSGIIESSSLID